MNDEEWYPSSDDDEDLIGNIHQRTEELYRVKSWEADPNGLITCPAFELEDVVVFPHMISPVFLRDEPAILAVEAAQEQNKTAIALFWSDEGDGGDPLRQFLPIGMEMAVGRMLTLQGGEHSALVQGRRRVEIVSFVQTQPYLVVEARPVTDNFRMTRHLNALMRTARNLFEQCVALNDSLPEEAHLFSINISDPGWLADMIATSLPLTHETRKNLMTLIHPADRLKQVNQILAEELDVLELEDEIQAQVQTEVDRSHREYYLREQMKAIQIELGEDDIWSQETRSLSEKIDSSNLPEPVKNQASRELQRLQQMPPMAPEVGIIRTYIDWILDLPWTQTTEDNLDVVHALDVLEKDHYGLKKAKDRIIEYIAIRSLNPKRLRQPILCFVGPPGTGKTSLGKSIASALGREFVRLSLGGVRDEAEIRGHRRTYIGAMPGRIIQTMRRAGTKNPLFMLDEIDKLGADFRGDPSSALLEV